VRRAIEQGDLPLDRVAAYVKLRREARYFEMRNDEHARRVEGRRFGRLCRKEGYCSFDPIEGRCCKHGLCV